MKFSTVSRSDNTPLLQMRFTHKKAASFFLKAFIYKQLQRQAGFLTLTKRRFLIKHTD